MQIREMDKASITLTAIVVSSNYKVVQVLSDLFQILNVSIWVYISEHTKHKTL